MIAAITLVSLKYYRTSLCVFAALLSFVPVLGFTASYYIASDQFRFHYRKVEGTTYFEFPGGLTLLRSIVHSLSSDSLVNVTYCGDAKVAMLPPLPIRPLVVRDDASDEIQFRRFPRLQFEGIELKASVSTGSSILADGNPRQSFGFQLATSTDPFEISLTRILPRSLQLHQRQDSAVAGSRNTSLGSKSDRLTD
jgi:hypothetical protein